MHRLTSVVLSLCLTGLSAGLAPYAAWGQVRAQAVTAGSAARGFGASVVSPVAPGAVQFAPTLPASVSLSATLPLAPAPAPRSAVLPVAAAAHAAAPAAALAAPAAVPAAPAAVARAALAEAPAALAQSAVFSPAAAAAALQAAPNAAAPARAAAPVSAETDASVSGHFFDGSLSRRGSSEVGVGSQVAGRSRPALNAASDEASEASPEQTPAPAAAPLLEGRLDIASYKLPWDLRARRALALGAHYGLMAAVPVLLGVGLGLVPLAVGAAALGVRLVVERVKSVRANAANGADELTERELRATRDLLLRHKRGEALSDAERAELETRAAPFEQLLTWAEGTVDYLTGRMGRDPQSAPRVWIDESSHDLHWAASVGGTLDKSGAIYMGVGFVLRPLERAVGVLAHEMGHLFFGDKGKFRERLRMHGGLSGGFKTGMRDALSAAGAATAVKLAMVALSLADPTFLAWGLMWAAAAVASAAVALLAGLAATRQEELRADHFSAWLSEGSWLAAFLEDEAGRGREKRGRLQRWADHILSTHPAWETRVERLLSYAKPAVIREAVLPVSDSFWGLSGETQAVVTGADAALAEALAARAQGTYDFRLYQGMDGALVVRAHPVLGARVDAAPDRAVLALLASVLADKFPGSRLGAVKTSVHPAVEALRGSALGRELLAELSAAPIALRWEAGAPGAARAAFVASGPRPEVVLNSNVFWKASPKAQAAALASELARYRAWRAKAEAGPALDAMAEGTGARVFVELGGGQADDVETASGLLYSSAFTAWARRADLSPAERAWVAAHPWASFEARFLKR